MSRHQGMARASPHWTCPAPGARTGHNPHMSTGGLQKWACPPEGGLQKWACPVDPRRQPRGMSGARAWRGPPRTGHVPRRGQYRAQSSTCPRRRGPGLGTIHEMSTAGSKNGHVPGREARKGHVPRDTKVAAPEGTATFSVLIQQLSAWPQGADSVRNTGKLVAGQLLAQSGKSLVRSKRACTGLGCSRLGGVAGGAGIALTGRCSCSVVGSVLGNLLLVGFPAGLGVSVLLLPGGALRSRSLQATRWTPGRSPPGTCSCPLRRTRRPCRREPDRIRCCRRRRPRWPA